MAASNLAARRAAKANRRKAIVAQKRKAEAVVGTQAGQAAQAAALPIQRCLLTQSMFEVGLGSLILARGVRSGALTVAVFLLDSFCLGVKDVIFRSMTPQQLDAWVASLSSATSVAPVDPAYARKLLHDLVRWSAARGFPPARDFAAAERLFGTVDPRTCDATFEFGMQGKPLYIGNLEDSPWEVLDFGEESDALSDLDATEAPVIEASVSDAPIIDALSESAEHRASPVAEAAD
jgi:hypothetical protein